MNDTTTLHDWLGAAWDSHASAPRQVADGLAARVATLPNDADGADAVRLAEHVLLAHLADAAALRHWLAQVPEVVATADALSANVQRARWALAALDGNTPPAVPDATRWRALHSVVMALVHRGDTTQARTRLLADAAEAMAHNDIDARKAFAATANNTALDLRIGPRGHAARDALMLDAAQLARRAWAAAGGWMQIERADYQLAMCHAVLGQGAPAVAHAGACLARCEAEDADAAERFFAHECNVHALRAAGHVQAAADHRAHMAALLQQISDAGLRQWCAETLATT